jgi:hypothetical protein
VQFREVETVEKRTTGARGRRQSGDRAFDRLCADIERSIDIARAEGVSLERFLATQFARAPDFVSREGLSLLLGSATVRWFELDLELGKENLS